MPNIPFSIALGAEEILLSFLYRQGGHNQTLSKSKTNQMPNSNKNKLDHFFTLSLFQ
jgi:hypothetical protein